MKANVLIESNERYPDFYVKNLDENDDMKYRYKTEMEVSDIIRIQNVIKEYNKVQDELMQLSMKLSNGDM